MKPPPEPVVIGIDLGGTKILSAVVTRGGKVLGRAKRKTRPDKGQIAILDRMATCARDAADAAGVPLFDVQGVGVGSPGPLDTDLGIVIETPNLPLTDAPIVASLERDLGLPVVLDNDVNVGTLGEKVYGVGQDVGDLIGLFPGTGLGGGIIIDGRLHRGVSKNAGELGHMTVVVDGALCGCGKRGCLEAYASRTAIVRRIQELVKKNKKESPIQGLIQGQWERATSGVLAKALEAGDDAVKQALDEASRYLGVGIGSLCNILGPEKIVLGGGVIEALGDQLLPLIRKTAVENAFDINIGNVEIVPASLGDDAGILGAAALIWQALDDKPELSSRRNHRTLPAVESIQEDRIILSGAHYTYDVIIAPRGDVLRRSRRNSKEEHGVAGCLTLTESESIIERFSVRPVHLLVAAVNPGDAVDEAVSAFLRKSGCELIVVTHAAFPVAYRDTPEPKAAIIMLKP